MAGIDRLDPLPRLLRALAQIAGQMGNYNPRSGKYPASYSGLLPFFGGKNLVKELYLYSARFAIIDAVPRIPDGLGA